MPRSSPAKHRFQNSLDLAAARAMWGSGCIPQSGTGNFWAVEDSPTLGYMLGAPGQFSDKASVAQGSRLAAPAHVKKLRRRGLSEGMHLTLPPSPLPPRSPSITPPPMSSPPLLSSPSAQHLLEQSTSAALAFTAEWDYTLATFIFTPVESAPPSGLPLVRSGSLSSGEGSHTQRSVPSTPSTGTPWSVSPPVSSRAPVPPVPPPARCGRSCSTVIVSSETELPMPGSPSASGTPASSLFDVQAASHTRKGSQSTAASSVVDLALLVDEEHRDVEKQDKQDVLTAPNETAERSTTERQPDLHLVPPWVRDKPSSDMRRAAELSTSSVYSVDSVSSCSGSSAKAKSLRRQFTKALSITFLTRR